MKWPHGIPEMYVELPVKRFHNDELKLRRIGTIYNDHGHYYLYRHFDFHKIHMRKNDSMAIDIRALKDLRSHFGLSFEIVNDDKRGRVWIAPLGYFFAYGILADFGALPQMFLGLEFWNVAPIEA